MVLLLVDIGMVIDLICLSEHIMEGRRCWTNPLREWVVTDCPYPFIDSCSYEGHTTTTMPTTTKSSTVIYARTKRISEIHWAWWAYWSCITMINITPMRCRYDTDRGEDELIRNEKERHQRAIEQKQNERSRSSSSDRVGGIIPHPFPQHSSHK